ncbi:putative phosphohistidine phosphatase, SixA [Melioribacter roseus P3M-2]|jgi:phosphohistidine phosphatase|uniref:Putative phosphohistidine phosphatase, SixA n=1 Tax=Melioribacter roseus (strain DSM 23840 / JCM 17771 / VKM B-2668 / P3M-2) TaxID=1191523 RepID=I6YVY7_MELRP|nr:histidine phosphatase family protein [Melioribacter roseus]AFN74757.1 putative phosphohistidine phosphatase, SixA [Melioribacter roseus P3M-2]
MKKLFLIRHAKSSWDNPGLTDMERPLNKRGERDAPFMARLIKEKGIEPDLIISSPAKRAFDTALVFASIYGKNEEDIIVEDRIYEAGMRELSLVVEDIDDRFESVFLFGHNPGLTNFANLLGSEYLDNMPTCSIVGIGLNVDSWKNIERGKGKTFLFEYPKKYF